MTFSFEKLEVWVKAKELVKILHHFTGNFPEADGSDLASTIRRASVLVCNNLAKGSVRFHIQNRVRYFAKAHARLMETANMTMIACELNYASEEECREILDHIELIHRMLSALHKSSVERERSA